MEKGNIFVNMLKVNLVYIFINKIKYIMSTLPTALITKASSGIGYELSKILAREKTNLILVARNGNKLEAVKNKLEQKYKISVGVIEEDLSEVNAAEKVINQLQGETIDILVNNTGFGDYGEFARTSWKKEAQMIQLNITTLTQFCKLLLPRMIEQRRGKILNVAAGAIFQPASLMAIYNATKAYILSFSETIATELKDTGVTVTALCPGPTEPWFQEQVISEEPKSVKENEIPTMREIAEYGYQAMKKGRIIAFHGFQNKALANTIRFMPRNMMIDIVNKIQKRVN